MTSSIRERCCRAGRLVCRTAMLVLALALPAGATDGVIEINQLSALAGGITAGDAPGFPVTISVGGSYRLTGSLSLGAGQPDAAAIVVSTPNGVVIDLNSHNTASGNHIGIAAGGTSMVVSNSARSNTGAGIACNGCLLVGNSAHANTGVGFQLDAGAGYSQSILRSNNGGNDQAQVSNGVDLGQNLCGAPEVGNGVICP